MENQQPPNNQHQTTLHALKLIIALILGFALMMLVFGVGIWVGQKRAEFSFGFAEEYHRNFGGPQRGIFGNFPAQDFTNGHGLFGQVLQIDGNEMIVKGQDNVEKTVVMAQKTTIMDNSSKLSPADIKINDTIVVIGAPDANGRIQAEFIRILPGGTSMIYQSNLDI